MAYPQDDGDLGKTPRDPGELNVDGDHDGSEAPPRQYEPSRESNDWYNRTTDADERQPFTSSDNDQSPSDRKGDGSLKGKEDSATDSPIGDAGAGDEQGSLYHPSPPASNKARFKSIRSKWKKMAVGGGIAASIVGAIVAFIGALLPLKLEFILNGIDEYANAATEYAVGERLDALVGHYMTRRVFQGAMGPNVYIGNTLLSTLYNNWYGGRFENDLFEKYGISFETVDRNGDAVPGQRASFWRVSSNGVSSSPIEGLSIDLDKLNTDLDGRSFRRVVRQAIRNETRSVQIIKRIHMWRIIKNKYHVPDRLVPAWWTRATTAYREKKLAFKKWIVKRAIGPFSAKYGALFTCIMDSRDCGDFLKRDDIGNFDSANEPPPENPDNPNDIEKAHAEGADKAEQAADNLSNDKLDNIMNKLADDGSLFDRALAAMYFQREIIIKFLKVGSIVAMIDVIARIDKGIREGTLSEALYAMQAINVVNYALPFATANSQYLAGGLPAEQMDFMMDELNNFETSTLYQTRQNGLLGQSREMMTLYGSSPIYAEGTLIERDCDGDGVITPEIDFVPAERPVCSPMVLNKDVKLFTDDAWYRYTIGPILWIYNNTLGGFFGVLFDAFNSAVDFFLGPAINAIMGATGATEKIAQAVEWSMGKLISPACTGLETSGADAFDCLAAGIEMADNAIPEEAISGIAGKYLPPEKYNEVVTYQMNEYQKDWQSQPLFARLFSTSSHRSLLAQAIMSAPSSASSVASSIARAFSNPFSSIASAFGGVLTPAYAQAEVELPADFNPFGIVHYGYELGDPALSTEPDTGVYADCDGIGFDNQNDDRDASLENGPDDEVPWAVYTVPNYCALEKTAVEAAGALWTSTDLNDSEDNTPDASSVLIGQEAQQLATQLLAHPNIVFENFSAIGDEPAECRFEGEPDAKTKTIIPISNGEGAVVCTSDKDPHLSYTAVSAELLRILLQAANDGLRLSLKSITTRDHSEGSEHYVGLAVDLAPNDALYRYIYYNSYAHGGNFCVGDMIHLDPPAGTHTMVNGVDGTYSQSTLDGHSGHIHLSVMGNLSACGR